MKGILLKNIRLDGAGENREDILTDLEKEEVIKIEYSLPYAPQSNRTAERLIQELGRRKKTLIADSGLPDTLWTDEM